jgi:hypothetical protein
MNLSDKIASGDTSPEVVEAVAFALGWAIYKQEDDDWGFVREEWTHDFSDGQIYNSCPNYLTDIRLTLAEIERAGWLLSLDFQHTLAWASIWNGADRFLAERQDRNLALVAVTALLRAKGE